MATVIRDYNVDSEDIMPVASRVSWGAILAGVFVSLAVVCILLGDGSRALGSRRG